MLPQIFLVIYCTPVGIASLIAQTILKACNIVQLLQARLPIIRPGAVGLLAPAQELLAAAPTRAEPPAEHVWAAVTLLRLWGMPPCSA